MYIFKIETSKGYRSYKKIRNTIGLKILKREAGRRKKILWDS